MIFIYYSYFQGKEINKKEIIFDNLLNFRLETLSYGENALTQNHWNQAKNLEFTRRQRMNI
jgi:hypothetical protein